jgi:hypothetical protein
VTSSGQGSRPGGADADPAANASFAEFTIRREALRETPDGLRTVSPLSYRSDKLCDRVWNLKGVLILGRSYPSNSKESEPDKQVNGSLASCGVEAVPGENPADLRRREYRWLICESE